MGLRKIQVVMTSVLLLGTGITGFAQQTEKNKEKERQEDLNREMTLERDYDPIVQDASKITTLPAVREINIIKRPISYSDYAVPMLPDKEMNILPPDKLQTEIARTKRDGYLHFGGGMLLNMMGDFGYHILNTERDRIGVYFSHRSTNGDVKFGEGMDENLDYRKLKFNDNIGGLDFKHHFKVATLTLGGQYGYSAFNYYGLPTNRISYSPSSFYIPGSSMETVTVLNYDTKTNQVNQLIHGYGGISSDSPAFIGYHIHADYTYFNQKYSIRNNLDGMTENHIGIDLGIRSRMNNRRCFGVDVKANILNYTAPDIPLDEMWSPISSAHISSFYFIGGLDSVSFKTHFNATLNPFFRMENEQMKMLLGVNLMLVSQNDETKFYVSPNITLDVPFAHWSIFYAHFGGGITSNSMAELSREHRYINPAFTADASKTWADLKIGVRSNAATGFWFDIFAGYKYTESDVLLNPSSYEWIADGFNNVIMAFQPATQRIQAGVTLKYDYQKIVDFYLKGVYNHYTLTYMETRKNTYAGRGLDENSKLKAYGVPAVVANAGINVRPVKPLTLCLDYCLMSGIYAHTSYDDDVKMKTINDLRFRTSWKFNDMFSIYAQFNNVLFRQQELYYRYPLQPFSAMAGFNVNF